MRTATPAEAFFGDETGSLLAERVADAKSGRWSDSKNVPRDSSHFPDVSRWKGGRSEVQVQDHGGYARELMQVAEEPALTDVPRLLDLHPTTVDKKDAPTVSEQRRGLRWCWFGPCDPSRVSRLASPPQEFFRRFLESLGGFTSSNASSERPASTQEAGILAHAHETPSK